MSGDGRVNPRKDALLETDSNDASALLEFRGVNKIYGPEDGGHRALEDVNLSLPGGKIYGLLGPNGAGKTTLLRISATLLAPTRGDAWVAGWHTVKDAAEVRGHLGYLSASTSVYERLSPTELMRYFGRLHGLSPDLVGAQASEVFNSLEITPYKDRPIGKLSTGMRQKVSIARAFLHKPPVLILDEPTNGLDVVVRQSLLDLLRSYCSPDRLLILSTHDLPEAEELCDAFIFLVHGRVIRQVDRDELHSEGHGSLRAAFFHALERSEDASAKP